ncbi:hypothetical protein C8Q78DRAFT_735350 [Trametes maxima]|nr:hypothetical protein C8Q78DRAFT_735350 [Trametes maxima]
MESTPAPDFDPAHTHPSTPAGPGMSYAPLPSSSSMHHGHGVDPSSSSGAGPSSSSVQPKCSSGPHIRSRITVVCAEVRDSPARLAVLFVRGDSPVPSKDVCSDKAPERPHSCAPAPRPN